MKLYINIRKTKNEGGIWGRGHNCMVVGFTTTLPMPITTKVVSLNPVHGEVYSIQYYEIEFVSGLQQVGGFLHQ